MLADNSYYYYYWRHLNYLFGKVYGDDDIEVEQKGYNRLDCQKSVEN